MQHGCECVLGEELREQCGIAQITDDAFQMWVLIAVGKEIDADAVESFREQAALQHAAEKTGSTGHEYLGHSRDCRVRSGVRSICRALDLS